MGGCNAPALLELVRRCARACCRAPIVDPRQHVESVIDVLVLASVDHSADRRRHPPVEREALGLSGIQWARQLRRPAKSQGLQWGRFWCGNREWADEDSNLVRHGRAVRSAD